MLAFAERQHGSAGTVRQDGADAELSDCTSQRFAVTIKSDIFFLFHVGSYRLSPRAFHCALGITLHGGKSPY